MSSLNLDTLITSFPEEREAINKVADLFERGYESRKGAIFSVNRIIDVADGISEFALAMVLHTLESKGIVTRIIRVETDDGIGIKDFASITEVPDSILDWRRDVEMRITPQNLRVYYQVRRQAAPK